MRSCPRDRARARHGHGRRRRRAGAEGHGTRGERARRRDRDPRLLLRAAARAAGRRLPHVPLRGRRHAEDADRLHDDRDGRHGRAQRPDIAEGRRGAGLDAGVHPRQPPARLPGLRQGRRVSAAGPHIPLRPRCVAHVLPEADVREADPDLADDRARPRALHPLLPLHALQRVALNRGAQSVIATFDEDPYRGAFSGNVIELCPVGALTSTQYRFEARPWEIQNAPTICGMCPVGCNISATTREGKVKRILSRNHPEIDEGWLCDKGRFAFSHLYAPDRATEPLRRRGRQSYAAVSPDEALDEAERLLREAGTHIVTALSGSETVEQAYALAKLLRRGLGAHAAVMPEVDNARLLDGFRRPLSSIRDAQIVVVLGDEPVAERAPIVDLWLRAARRNGAEILHELDEEKVRAAERALLIWSGADGEERLAAHAQRLGVWAAFFLPRAPNARGVCDAWAAAADEEEPEAPD